MIPFCPTSDKNKERRTLTLCMAFKKHNKRGASAKIPLQWQLHDSGTKTGMCFATVTGGSTKNKLLKDCHLPDFF